MKRCVQFLVFSAFKAKFILITTSACYLYRFYFIILLVCLRFCQAKTHVCDIEQRLQGVIKSRNKVLGLPLSIAGHVHYLIQEATDDKLLCQMYLGWGPYL